MPREPVGLMDDICPISHIHVTEVLHPVCFRGAHSRIFSADHLVEWLKHYSLTNPLTGAPVDAGLATRILKFKSTGTPHSEKMQRGTELYLKSAGYLDGRGGKVLNYFINEFFC